MSRRYTGCLTNPVSVEGQKSGTPPEFYQAVAERWGPIGWDLAAHDFNHIVEKYLTEEIDALTVDWHALPVEDGETQNFLNPEFGYILPWVRKAEEESRFEGVPTGVLLPASVDSAWFKKHVLNKCECRFIPRLVFIDPRTGLPHVYEVKEKNEKGISVGTGVWKPACYPKPLMFLRYGLEIVPAIGWWDHRTGEEEMHKFV